MTSERAASGAMDGRETSSFWRNRGLTQLNRRFAPARIDELLQERLTRTGSAALLEIGCGEGRVLLDLMKLLPEVRLFGVNKKPWPGMAGAESLRELALREGLFSAAGFDAAPPPDLRFGDARELGHDDASMDLVVSQVALHYVARKDCVLEEVWRVLKPGGRAFLHLDSSDPGAPDLLRGETPRFVIWEGEERLPLAAFLRRLRRRGFAVLLRAVRSQKSVQAHVLMEKNRPGPLALGLEFDAVSSFDLRVLRNTQRTSGNCWGFRSVFRLPRRRPFFDLSRVLRRPQPREEPARGRAGPSPPSREAEG